MNSDSVSGEQRELVGELRRRFPLFERLVGRFGKDVQEEGIPWFFALLLAAATRRDPGACCFVLDKTRGTTAVAAVLLALVKLQDEFPELIKNYAQKALHPGQRVKVKPNDYVYEYDGPWERDSNFFRLKVLDREVASLNFPMVEVLRLEPTDRIRPKGPLDHSVLGTFERSRLDELLDLTTCGNNSLIQNTVLLYMAQAQFAEVLDTVALAPEHANGLDSLSGFLPWGSIGQDGELKPNDAYQVAGEPIVAVTRVPEDLASASSAATNATKIVLVDGARGLARDLQAFDDIVDRQRMVILASPEETEALELLEDRGCQIWHMSPDEILIGEASIGNRERASLVGVTIRAADIRQRVKVTIVDCQDSVLQTVAASLECVAAMIEIGDEEEHESEEILARLYGILLECSECCFGIGEETKGSLRVAREQIARYRNWLDPKVARILQEATCRLEKVIVSGSYQEKADALLNIIFDGRHESWVVAARSPRTAECLRTGLGDLGVDVPVLPVSAINPDRDYTGFIVPAWPNEKKFTRLKNLAVTPDIRVLAYPFEREWVLGYQRREHARVRSSQMGIETRSSILGIEPHLLTTSNSHEPDLPVADVSSDLPIFRIEDRVARRRTTRPAVAVEGEDSREAQTVWFFGDCYALLTEWAGLPRLNELIDKVDVNEAKPETVTASQLSPGDFVLFRVSGEKEFVRLIAEDILGAREYERVRAIAERWKSSLQHLGTSPIEVQQHLAASDLERTTATIAGWLSNPDRIGPGDFRDIEAIARAARDEELLSIRGEVKEAITRIRGVHISAGSRLTQLILGELGGRLSQLDDQPVLLDLDYGEAWIVQVDIVEMTKREYPVNLVNRLLWVDDTEF